MTTTVYPRHHRLRWRPKPSQRHGVAGASALLPRQGLSRKAHFVRRRDARCRCGGDQGEGWSAGRRRRQCRYAIPDRHQSAHDRFRNLRGVRVDIRHHFDVPPPSSPPLNHTNPSLSCRSTSSARRFSSTRRILSSARAPLRLSPP